MSRVMPAFAVAAALVLVACGDGSDPDPASTATATADEALRADLPDGVAAQVEDVEIDSDRVDERVDTALENPQLAQQLPEDEEQARSLVQASVLGQMVITEAVLQAADEEGIEVSDEDIAEKRSELEEQAGGVDALQQQVDAIGFSDEELDRELRSLAVLDEVREREAPDAGPTASPAPGQPDPGDLAVQEWLREKLTGMQIVVDSDYGRWDAQQLQVVPPQSAMQPPPGAPSPAHTQ